MAVPYSQKNTVSADNDFELDQWQTPFLKSKNWLIIQQQYVNVIWAQVAHVHQPLDYLLTINTQ